MKRKTFSILALALPIGLAGCGGFQQEAGAFLDGGTFGNATMNNHLVQTCADVTNTKYSTGRCAPRTLDGKYAQATYNEYVGSATEIPRVTTSFGDAGTSDE